MLQDCICAKRRRQVLRHPTPPLSEVFAFSVARELLPRLGGAAEQAEAARAIEILLNGRLASMPDFTEGVACTVRGRGEACEVRHHPVHVQRCRFICRCGGVATLPLASA